LRVNAYYGSTVKFDDWDITKTREFGYHFGINDDNQSLHRIRDGGYLYEVDLTFSNPLTMRDALRWDLRSIADELGIPYDDLEREARLRARKNFSALGVERNLIAAELLDDRGYDAILYENQGETGGDAIIVWNPGQIQVLGVTRIERDSADGELGLRVRSESVLRSLIRNIISEIDIEDVEGICMTRGSTHVMNTCYIGGDKFHLKTPDENAEFKSTTNPSLQSLVEYLAYRIFDLYPDVTIPGRIELVYDRRSKVVSLATKTVPGKHGRALSLERLGEGLSASVYVNVFLANWDVGNTANIIVRSDDSKPVLIDPGGSLIFRARGGEKGEAFGDYPRELETMIDGTAGAAEIFRYSDLRVAARTFNSVPWSRVEGRLDECNEEITRDLTDRGFDDLLAQWGRAFDHILKRLRNRHREILANVKFVESVKNGG